MQRLCQHVLDVAAQRLLPIPTALDAAALHISLTRPLLLRRSEQAQFFQAARVGVASTHTAPFVLGFAQFVCFPSDTSTRVFLCLEVNAGWHEMHTVTCALNRQLHALFQAQPYYTAPRFHTSIAYWDPQPERARSQLIQQGEALAAYLNTHADTHVRCGPVRVHEIVAQFGKATMAIRL